MTAAAFISGWGATIRGSDGAIAHWKAALKQPFDPWVESHGDETLLRSAAFDELKSAEQVRDRAVALIDRLNGAMALSRGSGPVRFAGVTQVMPNGIRHRTLIAETAQYQISGHAVTITVGPSPGQPSEVQLWAGLAEDDDFLDDALIYFGTSTEWFDIYKTLETLILRFGPTEEAFFSLNWAAKKDVELLKRTANWARHAKRKFKPPEIPCYFLKQAC